MCDQIPNVPQLFGGFKLLHGQLALGIKMVDHGRCLEIFKGKMNLFGPVAHERLESGPKGQDAAFKFAHRAQLLGLLNPKDYLGPR